METIGYIIALGLILMGLVYMVLRFDEYTRNNLIRTEILKWYYNQRIIGNKQATWVVRQILKDTNIPLGQLQFMLAEIEGEYDGQKFKYAQIPNSDGGWITSKIIKDTNQNKDDLDLREPGGLSSLKEIRFEASQEVLDSLTKVKIGDHREIDNDNIKKE